MAPYNVSEVKPYLNILLYAEPGTGKTTLAATAQAHPDMSPVLVLNIEGGLLSIQNVPGIEAEDIKSVAHLEEIFWKLINKEEGYDKYKTVVIDSGSEVQTMDLEQIAREAWEKDQKQPESKRKRKSMDDLWQNDYGEDTAKLKRVFRWFRDAPFHTIITALSRENYSKKKTAQSESVLQSVTPAFTEKLANAVMGYCDMVWYMYLTEGTEAEPAGERRLLTTTTGVYRAKTRGQEFAKKLGNPSKLVDLAEIYNLLLKSEGIGQKQAS